MARRRQLLAIAQPGRRWLIAAAKSQLTSQSASAGAGNRSRYGADARSSTMRARKTVRHVMEFGPFSFHGPCPNRPTRMRYSYPI